MDRFGPEISDLVIDYDPTTLERRDITKQAVLDRLRATGMPARAARIARTLAQRGELLDRDAVDGVLIRSHLELQRLHEEFRVGAMMRALIVPMLARIRRARPDATPIRIVDLGCGLGFVLRWLAAHGELGADVELIGADYNRTFVAAAQRLADAERLPCRFVAGNAFAMHDLSLAGPAHLYLSTGVLHHFRGDDLAAVFAEHERSPALAFIHLDIRPSWVAPFGSWIFHQARMREPLAKFDGYWSTVRAHSAATLRAAVRHGAPGFTLATIDAHPGLHGMIRIFQAVLGVRAGDPASLATAYAGFGRRYEGT